MNWKQQQQNLTVSWLEGIHFKCEDTDWLQVKGEEKIQRANSKYEK